MSDKPPLRPVSELLSELARAKNWQKGDEPIQLQFPELCEVLLDLDRRLRVQEEQHGAVKKT